MNGVYNKFLHRRATNSGDTTGAGALRALLLRSTSTYTFNPDHDFVSDLFANGGVEITVASYVRKTLTSVQWVLDDPNDYTVLKFDNIPFGNLESGQTVVGCVIYEFNAGVDTTSPLIYHIDGKIRVVAAAPAVSSPSGTILGASQANPVVITSNAHGRVNGEVVYISGIVGMTQLNNRSFTVAGATANNFQLAGENGISHTPWSSGGTWSLVRPVYVEPLREAINDGTPVVLGGATGFVSGNHIKGARAFNVRNLSANVVEGDSGVHQTALNLPVALGGGSFNVNINPAGFLALLATKP